MTKDDLLDLGEHLKPAGWILVAVGLVCLVGVVFVIAGGLGFKWDPLNTAERRVDRAESTAAIATSNAGARSAEATGATDTIAKVEEAHGTIRAADAIIANNTAAAEAAPDAKQDLETDRVDRHRDVDRQLCELRPSVCPGYAASPPDAGDGRAVLRADPAPDRRVPL